MSGAAQNANQNANTSDVANLLGRAEKSTVSKTLKKDKMLGFEPTPMQKQNEEQNDAYRDLLDKKQELQSELNSFAVYVVCEKL